MFTLLYKIGNFKNSQCVFNEKIQCWQVFLQIRMYSCHKETIIHNKNKNRK
jgi:hypothetical protein